MAGKEQAVEIDKDILTRIMEADIYQKIAPEERKKYEDFYELSSTIRELQIYRLLQRMVADMNEQLKGKSETLRLFDEGKGLFLEMTS